MALNGIAAAGGGSTGTAADLVAKINAQSSLDIVATNPSTGKVLLTQGTIGTGGNTSITVNDSSHWNGVCSVNVPSAFSGGGRSNWDSVSTVNVPTAFTNGKGADLKIYAPDIDHRDGTLNLSLPRANYNRGPRRPVNIKNLKITTDSLSEAIGNYNKNYDVLNVSGRSANNKWFKDNHETAQTRQETPLRSSPRSLDYLLPTRPRNESVITERFSSPGDFMTMTRGFLDPMAEEYSVYNALPWRYHYQLNSSGSATDQGQVGSVALGISGALGTLGEDYLTRTGIHMAQHTTSSVHVNEEFSGLNVLLSRHQGRFGIDNPIGAVIEENYDSKAHYHKVHRNRRKRLEHVTTNYGEQYTSCHWFNS